MFSQLHPTLCRQAHVLGQIINSSLSILSILVASHWVHAVTGSAVGGRTVRLRSWEAVHGLDGVTPLAAAGRDGVGSVQATVKGRDGEVSLGLWRNPTGVAQDAHHLWREAIANRIHVVGRSCSIHEAV